MAEYGKVSSDAKSGQVPVKDMRGVASSVTNGGQAGVRSTITGDRGGNANSRGCVSPLGGVMNTTPGDQSQKQERGERPRRS